ncbi:MAG: hypothetical protein AVW06_01660 [Hadesarchaea archaeon DG-33-1]|nr:MAG: hypothetical protein AVW06_01660 [Hadesarchaea archaeon DG-33-1]
MVEIFKKLWYLVERRIETKRFLKFCLVGLSGVGVNLGLLWSLTEFLGLFYLLSAVVSVEASILSNFILNEFWTFSDRVNNRSAKPLLSRMIKFNGISVAGLAINIVILGVLTEFAGLYYIISELFAIGGATLWNYFANVAFTWR